MEVEDEVFKDSLFPYRPHRTKYLKDILSQWGFDASILVCTTADNGSNFISAIRSHLAWPSLTCFCHDFNLAIGNLIKDDPRVQQALGICRKIVTSFSHSWKKKQYLSEVQVLFELPQHSLVSDCVTWWGSQQLMIARTLEQESAVLASYRRCTHLLPSWQDIKVLQSIVTLSAKTCIVRTISKF